MDTRNDNGSLTRHLSVCQACDKAWITTYWIEIMGDGESWLCATCASDKLIGPPSVIETCNSCDFRPMALGDNPMGYCLPCLNEVKGDDSVDY